jgi:hypothetical protein
MLGAQLDMRLDIPRKTAEESIQLGDVFLGRWAIRFALIFLFKEDAGQPISEELDGGLMKLPRVRVDVQEILVLDMLDLLSASVSQCAREIRLRRFQKNPAVGWDVIGVLS